MKTSRGALVLVVAVAVGVMGLPSAPLAPVGALSPPEPEPDGVSRQAGNDRYGTAVALSRSTFRTSADVVLARGDTFPDALAASWLADVLDAPLLLTPPTRLHAETARELQRLQAERVMVLGGNAAVSPVVTDALEDLGIAHQRISGPSRIETSGDVARIAADLAGGTDGAILARADAFADALASASLAGAADIPVLLTSSSQLSPATADVLGDLLSPGDTVWLAGGTNALSVDVEQAVRDAGFDARRLAGADRYATGALLVDAARDAGAVNGRIVVASGAGFPDALAAGPVAIAGTGVLALVPPIDLGASAAATDMVDDLALGARDITVAGGPAAVSDDVLEALDAALFGAPEVVIHGGSVVSMTDDDPQAIALRGRRIVATGSAADLLASADGDTAVVDLDGAAVMPGFIDAHSHAIGDRDRYGVPTVDEAIGRRVRDGFTTLVELYVHEPRIQELVDLSNSSRLPIRVEAYMPIRDPQGGEFDRDYWNDHAPYDQIAEHVRIAGIKLHLDWDDLNFTEAQIRDLVDGLHRRGWTIAMHGIYRESAQQAIDVFTDLLAGDLNAHRHRIDHLLQLTDSMIAGIVDAGIVASVQIGGTMGNMYLSDWNREAYVDGREDEFGRWKDLDAAGARMIGSTDHPWFLIPAAYPDDTLPEDVAQAFHLLEGTVTRRGNLSGDLPDFVLDQGLTIDRALEMFTVEPAWQLDRAWEVGRLRPGFLADLVIATDDPRAVPVSQVSDIDVLVTMAEGRSAHCADDAPACPAPFHYRRPQVPSSSDASSSIEGAGPDLAHDGDVDTSWQSGGDAPAWISYAWEQPVNASRIELVVDQDPAGATRHVVTGTREGGASVEIAVLEGETAFGDVLVIDLAEPIDDLIALRVETESSPSFVSWGEITVLG